MAMRSAPKLLGGISAPHDVSLDVVAHHRAALTVPAWFARYGKTRPAADLNHAARDQHPAAALIRDFHHDVVACDAIGNQANVQ